MKTDSKIQVLIVDDEKDLTDFIAMELRKNECHVEVAYSAQEAIEKIERQDFDIIASDIRMPEKSGIDLLHWLRGDKKNKQIPMIFMTAFSDLTMKEAYHWGIDGIIVKPFQIEELLSLIRRLSFSISQRLSQPPTYLNQALKFQLDMPSLSEATSSGLIQFGRGGIFISCETGIPQVHEIVELHLNFQEQPNSIEIVGLGIVRWITNNHPNLKEHPGFGVELTFLEPKSLSLLLPYLTGNNLVSYIPRGNFMKLVA